jgi:type I restriction enzyme M protein
MSRENLANDIWHACDIMRRDDGTTGIMEYMEQLSWLLFLKAFEDIENQYEATVQNYGNEHTRVLDGPYRWSIWTGSLRKRAESKLAEARQTLNKAIAAAERARKRTDSLSADNQNGKKARINETAKTNELEQEYGEVQVAVDKAQRAFLDAKLHLEKTIAWLEDQVRILYEEQYVERQVLSAVERQFGGQLNLTQDQFNHLRDAERRTGQALAIKLVQGLVGQDLIDFVDQRLFPYLRHLTGTPEKDTISSIFREIPGNRMRSAGILQEVIDSLDRIHFDDKEDTQVVSQIYEVLLSRLGSEGGIAGEFYTPRPIVNFMVQAIDPEIGETIFDPFCGSAGFLVEAYKRMNLQERTPQDHEKLQRSTFYGQEKKPLPALLGAMNMILHGVLTPNITRTNTLEDNAFKNPTSKRYDIILTNPPFGLTEGAHVQANFPVSSALTELLALQYSLAKLRPNGRCGIVLPNKVLSSVSKPFVAVKKNLLENFNLYAIINLPAGVFANISSAGQGPRTNILFFEGPGPTEQIWYYDVRQVGFSLTKAQKAIVENDLPEAAETLRKYRQAVHDASEPVYDSRSWIVSADEVKQRSYDLNSLNPNNGNGNSAPHSLNELLEDMNAKYLRVGEILSELGSWLESRDVSE